MNSKNSNISPEIGQIIKKYKLQPHPEGGYFREVYRSELILTSPISKSHRNAVTHIYFLLVKGQVSRFHKVLHDEIWNFYEGTPLKLIEFDGSKIHETIIGCNQYFTVVKGGIFHAAESTVEYTLVGCSFAPGFDFEDFSFFEGEPELLTILKVQHPDYQRYI